MIIACGLVLCPEPEPLGTRENWLIPDPLVAYGRTSYKISKEGGRVPRSVLELPRHAVRDKRWPR